MNCNKRKYALITGISILVMALVAGYSYGFVFNSIVINAQANETLHNLQSSLNLFLSGIVGWGIILILDLLVAWGIYEFFQQEQQKLALFTALFRVVYTLFLGMAIFYLISVLPLVRENADATTVMAALSSFNNFWSLGLIVFGLHLTGLGLLALKSSSVPSIFAWLLLFAGISYFGIHAAKALWPMLENNIKQVELILGFPMAIGEIAFALWLLIRGGKLKKAKQ